MRKRASKGLLAGMYEFPMLEGSKTAEEVLEYLSANGLSPLRIQPLTDSKHIFTHKEWHMKGYEIKVDETIEIGGDCLFITMEQLRKEYSVPSAFRAYREYFLGEMC